MGNYDGFIPFVECRQMLPFQRWNGRKMTEIPCKKMLNCTEINV